MSPHRQFLSKSIGMLAGALCAASVVHAQAIQMPMPGKFVSVNTPSGLAPTHKLSCMSLSVLKNIYTPPDIYTAIRNCLAKAEYDDAAMLYPIAGAYAHFDAARVTDASAQGVAKVLSVQMFLTASPTQRQAFGKALTDVMSNPQKHAEFCSWVSKIGAPAYVPNYIIAHGATAPATSSTVQNALVPNFDATSTWRELQTHYLRCAN